MENIVHLQNRNYLRICIWCHQNIRNSHKK